MTAQVMEAAGIDRLELEQFLYLEAQLQDEHRYSEWEELWADEDVLYWVPAREGADPTREVSLIYDNRSRLASRIRQLNTGMRHAQAPQSRLRRLISNIVVHDESGLLKVESNFILIESRRAQMVTWCGRTTHVLIPGGPHLRIKEKTVLLVNCEEAISNLAFLI